MPRFLDYLYFAYGSNLNLAQMRHRCPLSIPVRTFKMKGWQLTFRRVADVEETKDPSDIVVGALYRITAMCEKSLDRFEGYKADRPKTGSYDKIDFRISSTGEDVMMYKRIKDGYSAPQDQYLERIAKGYRDWGLSTDQLMSTARRYGWRPHAEVLAELESTVVDAKRRRVKAQVAKKVHANSPEPKIDPADKTTGEGKGGIGGGNRFPP